jgi:uncharacterized protein (DUF169 family)
MRNYKNLADDLMRCLDLALPPIAVSFCDSIPAGVTEFDGVVPAGCVFWQLAATRTFATSAKDHELCSIGVHTHHMAQPAATHPAELKQALEAMSGLDYVRAEEVAAIPVLQREVKHVIYGPLADSPVDPEVVLLFANSQQGLVLSEAAGRVDKGVPPAMGRPACAVVPQVINHGYAAMSLGCCGARAYLDALSDSVSMWAFPGNKLEQYVEQIVVLARANKTLTAFHMCRREDVESGRRPTVQQSLERLSSFSRKSD